MDLTTEQVRTFREQGFLSLPALTTTAEVDALRDDYDRLFAPGSDVADGDRVSLASDGDGTSSLPQVLNPDRYAPHLRDTAAFAHAREIAAALLGDDARLMGFHAIRKPPGGAETPWHQDEAYWDPAYAHEAISVWMPLQPATLDNGCMQFVPGSHLLEVQPHRLADDDADGLVLADPRSVRGAVPCPLPAGGATVHSGRTLHHAGPNATDEPRRALIMAFTRPQQLLERPRSFPWQRPEWYSSGS